MQTHEQSADTAQGELTNTRQISGARLSRKQRLIISTSLLILIVVAAIAWLYVDAVSILNAALSFGPFTS